MILTNYNIGLNSFRPDKILCRKKLKCPKRNTIINPVARSRGSNIITTVYFKLLFNQSTLLAAVTLTSKRASSMFCLRAAAACPPVLGHLDCCHFTKYCLLNTYVCSYY